jgi:hypothetical protein
MGMYLHIHVSPWVNPGEGMLDVWAYNVDDMENRSRAEIYKGQCHYNDSPGQASIELWVIAAMRNALSTIEDSMFARLTSGQERLTLVAEKRKEELRVGASSPCSGRQ